MALRWAQPGLRSRPPTRRCLPACARPARSREEFSAILEEEELKDAAILVYANKQVRGRVGGWGCRVARGWGWLCVAAVRCLRRRVRQRAALGGSANQLGCQPAVLGPSHAALPLPPAPGLACRTCRAR